MMIDVDFERIVRDPTHPGLLVAGRFAAQQRFLELLLENVPRIQLQTLEKFVADTSRYSDILTVKDLQDEYSTLTIVLDELIPCSFYGAFAVALFAATEASIVEIADYVRQRESSTLAISDLRESSTLKRIALYLQALLREPMQVSPQVLDCIRDLQVVRNVLAHSNGDLSGYRTERLADVDRICSKGVGVSVQGTKLRIDPSFLHHSYAATEELVGSLLRQISERYPLPNED